MLTVLETTVPIYLALVVGFVAVRAGLIRRDQVPVLTSFAMNIALPALLFGSISGRDFGEILNPTYVGAYAVGVVLAVILGVGYGRFVRRARMSSAVLDGMACGGCNSGYLGFPVLLLVTPSVAGLALGLNMLVENLVLLPTYLVLVGVSGARHEGSAGARSVVRAVAGSLARTPMMWALVLGLAVAALGMPLPQSLIKVTDLFGRAASGVALFCVGGILAGIRLRGLGSRIAVVSVGKLLLHPALVVAAMAVLVALGLPPLDDELRNALIITGALPTMSVLPVLAAEFGEDQPTAGIVLATTALSFVTLSLLIGVLTG